MRDGAGCAGDLALVAVIIAAMGLGLRMGITASRDVIRADLAQQGCMLMTVDSGEGQTWMVECEGEGR